MPNNFLVTHTPRWGNNPADYLQKKLVILETHFYIKPTPEQLANLSTLTTQEKIDNAIFSIIDSKY